MSMWNTTAKKNDRLKFSHDYPQMQSNTKQLTTVELTKDSMRPNYQRLLLHAAAANTLPRGGGSAARSSGGGRQTLSSSSPQKLSFETPQRHLPGHADPYH